MPRIAKERESSGRRQIPEMTVEGREQELIYESIELAARQIRAGTASSQIITHFLKLGSTMSRLEAEKLARENELLRAKTEHVASQKNTEKLYEEALKAMRSYSGSMDSGDADD